MTAAFRPGVQVTSNSAPVLFLFHLIKISAIGNSYGDSKTMIQRNLQRTQRVKASKHTEIIRLQYNVRHFTKMFHF